MNKLYRYALQFLRRRTIYRIPVDVPGKKEKARS